MRFFKLLLALALLAGLSACSSKFKTYNGPEVTRIIVEKGKREMRLYHGNRVLKTYDVRLGFAPEGHKNFEGDGKTPEGRYYIDRRNPDSKFHLSIGISYPNANDIAKARAAGKRPGGDIFIHGAPDTWAQLQRRGRDWSAGCITVTNREIERIYAMVKNGTVIDIYP